ncbi:RNase H domain-containing protein [Trichonephila clavipes]|nr:RNase H domain-containing protein [Trichonephila clavipes]
MALILGGFATCGYVKSLVYADKPQTLDHLEDNIRRVIADIRPQMLEKVIENWTSRLDYIRASRGSHMPEIIFKIYTISRFFSDSSSAIQHLANWHNVRGRTGTDILKVLKRLSLSRQIHFQWIPSHVNSAGNEIADSLARAGADETTTPAGPLTYLELFSKYKSKNKTIWMIPPVHTWYQSKYSDGSLFRGSSRRHQTVLTRFLNDHLMSLTFVDGIKHFEICSKCSTDLDFPSHILSC